MDNTDWYFTWYAGGLTHNREIEQLALNDAYIINALQNCGVDWPTQFGLVWGDDIVTNEEFPLELRKIVKDIIQEEKKKKETSDPQERRICSIAVQLLQILYKKQVNDIVEAVAKIVREKY